MIQEITFRTKAELAGAQQQLDMLDKQIGKVKALQVAGAATEKQLASLGKLQEQRGKIASAMSDIMPTMPIPESGSDADMIGGKKGLIKSIKALKHELSGVPGLWEAAMLLKGGPAAGIIGAVMSITHAISVIQKVREELKEFASLQSDIVNHKGLDAKFREIANASRESARDFHESFMRIRDEVAETFSTLDRQLGLIEQRLSDTQSILGSKAKAARKEAEAGGATPESLRGMDEAAQDASVQAARKAREEAIAAADQAAKDKEFEANVKLDEQDRAQARLKDIAEKESRATGQVPNLQAAIDFQKKHLGLEGKDRSQVVAAVRNAEKPGIFHDREKLEQLKLLESAMSSLEEMQTSDTRLMAGQKRAEKESKKIESEAAKAESDSETARLRAKELRDRESSRRAVEDAAKESERQVHKAEGVLEQMQHPEPSGGMFGSPGPSSGGASLNDVVIRLDTLINAMEGQLTPA